MDTCWPEQRRQSWEHQNYTTPSRKTQCRVSHFFPPHKFIFSVFELISLAVFSSQKLLILQDLPACVTQSTRRTTSLAQWMGLQREERWTDNKYRLIDRWRCRVPRFLRFPDFFLILAILSFDYVNSAVGVQLSKRNPVALLV